MKFASIFVPLLGVTMSVGYGGLGGVAHAQNVPVLQSTTPTVQQVISLKNVAPSLVAWWLDPIHNEEPVQITGSEPKSRDALPPAQNKGAFALPAGITSIRALDARNALLVVGTEEAIGKVQETVAFLDKPLRQVEIEVQVVQLDAHDEKALGLDFGKAKPEALKETPEGFGLGFMRGTFAATLNRLIAENKAKVITAPRVTAINNMTATVGGWQSRPAVVGIKNEDGTFQEFSDPTAKGNAHLLLGTSSRLKITPTINNDNTVTFLMSFKRVLQLSSETSNPPSELRNLGNFQTVANVRDGETIALGGLTSQFLGLPENQKKNASNLLVLVTARIVRRVGDDIQSVSLQR